MRLRPRGGTGKGRREPRPPKGRVHDDRPDRVIYRMTKAGRADLESWLNRPFVRQSGYRDDFFLKLLAASRLGRKELADTLRVQRKAYLAELSSLTALRSQHDDEPLVSLLIEAAIHHTDVNLQIVEDAELRADALTALARSRPSRSHSAVTDAREAGSQDAS